MNVLAPKGSDINDIAAQAFDPSASVFVSANAGAGKTSLLTNRVLSLLLHGVFPSRILCLTFTQAAAAEMANRVTQELGKWVMSDDLILQKNLTPLLRQEPSKQLINKARMLFAQVLESPEGVRIQTIHGFCQSLLKRFPIEANVNPHFSVLDARSEQSLLQESRLRLFTHAEQDKRLRTAIETIARESGERSFHELLREVLDHKRWFRFLFSRAGVEGAIAEMRARLEAPEEMTIKSLLKTYFLYEPDTRKSLTAIVESLQQGSAAEQKTAATLEAWLAADEREILLEEYLSIFFKKTDGLPRAKLCNNGTLTEDLFNIFKLEQDRARVFREAHCALEAARRTEHMLIIADALLSGYEALKHRQALMDYDDLILTANDLLKKPGIAPWVLFKLDGGIDHVLVDEAQDTSPEQWSIIDALTQHFFAGQGRSEQERSLFVVGDEKQSIFSFQGADPSALGRMRRYFIERIQDAAKPAHTFALTHSYRSTREILAAVDAVFAQEKAKIGLMMENSDLAHIPTRLEHPGLVEIWPLIEKSEEESASPQTRLARMIAETIRFWMEEGVRPGDIMILVRSRTSLVDRLIKQLKRRHIPVAGQDRMQLGDNLAVQDLIALGECLLLPEDDLTLAALLKSPIFNLSEEELFRLAWNRQGQSLWERLRESNNEAYALLADLRGKADFISPFELYTYLLDTQGARKRITGRMGEEYQDALDEFLSQTLLYEASHPASLQGFLHWLKSSDSLIKRDMEQTGNAVRILTVHGAKGLQAPIVILPDTIEKPKAQEALLWDEAVPFWPGVAAQDNDYCASLRETRRQAMLAEYRRLLYVALTRAENRLYICGAINRESADEECWYHLVRSGLTPMATEFDMPWGKGLRIGRHPEHSEVSLRKRKDPSALPQDDMDFLHHPALLEPAPSKPLTPSRLATRETASSPLKEAVYQRGLLIHTLLQHLSGLPADARSEAGRRMARAYPQDIREECLREALGVLQHTESAFLFGEGSLAEVPVAGCVDMNGQIVTVAGQIDRLYVGKHEVWIVDYKSNRLPPMRNRDIPKGYLRQMQLYRLLLKAMYPEKTVRTALLWTVGPRLTVLDDGLLDEMSRASYIHTELEEEI